LTALPKKKTKQANEVLDGLLDFFGDGMVFPLNPTPETRFVIYIYIYTYIYVYMNDKKTYLMNYYA